MSTKWYATFGTPLGEVLATASDAGITGLYFVGQKHEATIQGDWTEAPGQAWLAAVRGQIDEYLAGVRRTFSVPLDSQGTAFQRRVWNALLEIPAGATVTYAELAGRVGAPLAARAAGAAVGRNPVSVIVPCHRVVGASGALTGYAGGLDRKRALLDLERAAGAPHAGLQALRHDPPGVTAPRLEEVPPSSRGAGLQSCVWSSCMGVGTQG